MLEVLAATTLAVPFAVSGIRKLIHNSASRHNAYHEAGHVVVSLALGHGFESVTVRHGKDGSKGVVTPYEDTFSSPSLKTQEDIVKIALAGTIASSIRYMGNHEGDAYSDNKVIESVLNRNPRLCDGINEKAYLHTLRNEVKDILLRHKAQLDSIADLLYREGTLTEKQVSYLMTRANPA